MIEKLFAWLGYEPIKPQARVHVFVVGIKPPLLDAPISVIRNMAKIGAPVEMALNGPSVVRVEVVE